MGQDSRGVTNVRLIEQLIELNAVVKPSRRKFKSWSWNIFYIGIIVLFICLLILYYYFYCSRFYSIYTVNITPSPQVFFRNKCPVICMRKRVSCQLCISFQKYRSKLIYGILIIVRYDTSYDTKRILIRSERKVYNV